MRGVPSSTLPILNNKLVWQSDDQCVTDRRHSVSNVVFRWQKLHIAQPPLEEAALAVVTDQR